jgi:hypothetical protein
LRSAIAIAETVGDERPDWELAAQSVAESITSHPERFEPKERFAMDWYYPMLAGIVVGDPGVERLREGWDEFVVEGWGIRCVSDRPWITSGETSEFILTLDALQMKDEAFELFGWLQHLRSDDGGFWMGANYPTIDIWPRQQPTWASGSVLLAWDALSRETVTSGFFRGETFLTAGVPDPL